MYSLLNSLDELIGIIGFLTIGLGIINCFLGYKYFKFIIALDGFVFGSIIGGILGLIGAMYLELSDGIIAVTIFTGLLFGIISAIVAFSVYKLGIFMMVFSITFVGTFALLLSDMSVWDLLFLDSGDLLGYAFIASIPASIAGGISVVLIKPTVIFTTAISGAYEIAWGFGTLINDTSLCIIATLILSAIGIAVQFSTNNNTTIQNIVIPNNATPKDDTTSDISIITPEITYDEPHTDENPEEIAVLSDIGDVSEILVHDSEIEPESSPVITESKLKLSSDLKRNLKIDIKKDTFSSEQKCERTIFSVPDDL